jgi:hypothetical protein
MNLLTPLLSTICATWCGWTDRLCGRTVWGADDLHLGADGPRLYNIMRFNPFLCVFIHLNLWILLETPRNRSRAPPIYMNRYDRLRAWPIEPNQSIFHSFNFCPRSSSNVVISIFTSLRLYKITLGSLLPDEVPSEGEVQVLLAITVALAHARTVWAPRVDCPAQRREDSLLPQGRGSSCPRSWTIRAAV